MALDDILMLSCRSPFLDDFKVYVPMASLYLKSFLEQNSNSTLTLGDDDYDINNLQLDNYDAVGISVMTPQREEAIKLSEAIKKQYPDMKLIVGGPHVKHYEQEMLDNPIWDYVVALDGERPFVEIAKGSKQRHYRETMSRKDIQEAPRPDRTSENAIDLIRNYSYTLGDREATTMMTSRGCPMMCTFCEDAGTVAKWSSIDNLKLEMDDIVDLGFKGVYLFDDLFAIAMPKVKPIAEELSKRDLVYRCNGQANFFTKWGEDFAKLLSDTGCVEIAFGHESGSQKILDNVLKRTSVDENYKSVEYAKKHGIKVKSFLMLGLPGEDEETIKQTEQFIKDAQPDDFQLAVYYPYKGTAIRDAIDAGKSDFDLEFEGEGLGAYGQKGGSSESVVRTSAFSSEELLQIRDELVNKYHPKSHKKKWGDKFFDTKQAN